MMTLLLSWGAAQARPTEAQMEQYLLWYAAGERDKLWEAASDRYRQRHCLGDPAQCPDLGRVPLGQPEDSSLSCDASRGRCTWTRTDRYPTPPLSFSKAVVIDWIVTTDLEGRFEGVMVDGSEPGAGGRALGRLCMGGCGVTGTFLAYWGVLFALLRVGTRRR